MTVFGYLFVNENPKSDVKYKHFIQIFCFFPILFLLQIKNILLVFWK